MQLLRCKSACLPHRIGGNAAPSAARACTAALGGSLSVLRTFRLARVFKLARSWKELNRIISALARSVASVGYLSLLLLLLVFVFALMVRAGAAAVEGHAAAPMRLGQPARVTVLGLTITTAGVHTYGCNMHGLAPGYWLMSKKCCPRHHLSSRRACSCLATSSPGVTCAARCSCARRGWTPARTAHRTRTATCPALWHRKAPGSQRQVGEARARLPRLMAAHLSQGAGAH